MWLSDKQSTQHEEAVCEERISVNMCLRKFVTDFVYHILGKVSRPASNANLVMNSRYAELKLRSGSRA